MEGRVGSLFWLSHARYEFSFVSFFVVWGVFAPPFQISFLQIFREWKLVAPVSSHVLGKEKKPAQGLPF